MPNFIDLKGERFRFLTVLRQTENNLSGRTCWLCQCDCGTKKIISSNQLRTGRVVSCGCWKAKAAATRQYRHGKRLFPEYQVWLGMKQRCQNSNSASFQYYGGRGIEVCERWSASFEAFIQDMGRRPSSNLTIERVNNDGNYEPSNCKWATRVEQAQNRSPTWTVHEELNLRVGIKIGYSFKKLSKLVGRSYGAVSCRAYKFGLRSGKPRNTCPSRAANSFAMEEA